MGKIQSIFCEETQEYRRPRPNELDLPEFNAVWGVIKNWDISKDGSSYRGSIGNDVVQILDALGITKENES